MSKRVCKNDQIRLIMECRPSGLSDYQWCKQNGIHPGNFYNWVSKFRNYALTKNVNIIGKRFKKRGFNWLIVTLHC